ncbi:G1 family glutamic endopeptidase [Streptacidiphilus jiangxiensis]|uniref:Peptidase A4 family protein n=1 Tax=Streptacidiphilus jiangxiensis TaxID=235985 RepID=A0A1H7ZYB5_STRJI|nr:G1 family glutamic endopeptidase [Streptacidiphilus jiangxiensis]SEM63273.1 Peptidase A4 family protein [Streptacidiphilus jiangxiensis]
MTVSRRLLAPASALALLAGAVAPTAAAAVSAPALLQAPMHHVSGQHGSTPFFISHGGGVKHTTTTSDNWSGYAATGSTYTSVSTTFVQPAVDCSQGDGYSSFWVGLDGYTSSSVEQTGTEADCSGGQAQYSAWYEMYPANPVTYSNTVQPGDTITETVSYASGTYTLTLADPTEGWTKKITKRQSGLARSSAEVIAEAPWSGSVLPLDDFGTVTFDNNKVNGQGLASTNPTGINMVSDSGTPEATISGLSGNAFSVTWNSL